MPEKVISEIRFVETDDGFRIEFKGDKERWRQLGFDPGQWQWGHKRRQGHGPHHGHGHQHHKHGRHWHGCSPSFEAGSWWGHWDEEPPERA